MRSGVRDQTLRRTWKKGASARVGSLRGSYLPIGVIIFGLTENLDKYLITIDCIVLIEVNYFSGSKDQTGLQGR